MEAQSNAWGGGGDPNGGDDSDGVSSRFTSLNINAKEFVPSFLTKSDANSTDMESESTTPSGEDLIFVGF